MSEKKSPQSKDSNTSIPQKPLLEEEAEQRSSPQISLDHATGIPPELPNLSNTAAIRRQLIQRLQGLLGNAAVVCRLASKGKLSDRVSQLAMPGFLQRDEEEEQEGEEDSGTPAAAAGAAMGTVSSATTGAAVSQNVTEELYNVSDTTLNAITGQLSHFDGRFGAQTENHLGISTEEMPIQRRPNGTLRVDALWSITSAVVGLPRWISYAGACAAAQQEWDRFMRRARQHDRKLMWICLINLSGIWGRGTGSSPGEMPQH